MCSLELVRILAGRGCFLALDGSPQGGAAILNVAHGLRAGESSCLFFLDFLAEPLGRGVKAKVELLNHGVFGGETCPGGLH